MTKPKAPLTNNRWSYAAPSTIHGRGLFARVDIPEGTLVAQYDGPRLSYKDGKKLAEEGNVFMFQANRREFIDGSVAWNLARHSNHSCEPNAQSIGVNGEIWLRARRGIAKGEEVTYDYGYSFRDDPSTCACGAPNCLGRIVASKDRDKIR